MLPIPRRGHTKPPLALAGPRLRIARRRPRMTLPCFRSSSRKRGMVISRLSSSASAVNRLATTGSATRSKASRPMRRVTNSRRLSSPWGAGLAGISGSQSIRALPRHESNGEASKPRRSVGATSRKPRGTG